MSLILPCNVKFILHSGTGQIHNVRFFSIPIFDKDIEDPEFVSLRGVSILKNIFRIHPFTYSFFDHCLLQKRRITCKTCFLSIRYVNIIIASPIPPIIFAPVSLAIKPAASAWSGSP